VELIEQAMKAEGLSKADSMHDGAEKPAKPYGGGDTYNEPILTEEFFGQRRILKLGMIKLLFLNRYARCPMSKSKLKPKCKI
jgi:hypothetical protein